VPRLGTAPARTGVPGHRAGAVARDAVGLFRHWWVIVKLALTVLSTLVLVANTTTLTALADATRNPAGHLGVLPSASPVLHSGAAVIVPSVLSVFKPKGVTRFGWRRQQAARGGSGR
jgi:hypothetical protein